MSFVVFKTIQHFKSWYLQKVNSIVDCSSKGIDLLIWSKRLIILVHIEDNIWCLINPVCPNGLPDGAEQPISRTTADLPSAWW